MMVFGTLTYSLRLLTGRDRSLSRRLIELTNRRPIVFGVLNTLIWRGWNMDLVRVLAIPSDAKTEVKKFHSFDNGQQYYLLGELAIIFGEPSKPVACWSGRR